MKPPEAPVVGTTPDTTCGPSAVSVCLKTMTKRADFLRASKAMHKATKGLILQARKRRPDEADPDLIRIGYTCSKKVGNAVKRNRAKRRLRAIVREVMPDMGHAGWDYVLIGRAGATADRDYIELANDLTNALTIIHGPAK